jgi:membrane-associated HD superfamily phosphohydrolase
MKKVFVLVMGILITTISMAQQGPLPRPGRPPLGPRNEKVELLKVNYITKELNLTKEEAEKYWPVYNEYHKNIRAIVEAKNNDEIQLEEAILNERKKYKNDLKNVFKSEERVNQALRVEREFMKGMRREIIKRKGRPME